MTVDQDAARLYAFRVWSAKQGELISVLIHLGDRLGLYKALAGAGPLTPGELAERTGLQERWVREWCLAQAAAELLVSADGTTFELPPEGAAVLADEEDSLLFAAGAFTGVPDAAYVDRLAEAFRTGIGPGYDDHGPTGAHRTERMLGPWARLALVPRILPALEGVTERLVAGGRVADVGCGAGVAVEAIARAFPAATVEGWDPSVHAIERARARTAGLDNVVLHQRRAEDLPAEGVYDLVLTFDCLHDMTRPDAAAAAIRRAIRPDGTWLIKDIRSTGDFRTDRQNPMLAMMYGFSVTSCMASALSEPGGAGLGTLGLPPAAMERLVRDAGFTRFRVHDFDDPANLYYEVRP